MSECLRSLFGEVKSSKDNPNPEHVILDDFSGTDKITDDRYDHKKNDSIRNKGISQHKQDELRKQLHNKPIQFFHKINLY